MSKLGDMLHNARKDKGLRLHTVARECGISIAYLSMLENGEASRPKIKMLAAAAAILQVPSDDLIIAAEKIPSDVYWKIVHNPNLLEVIRNLEV